MLVAPLIDQGDRLHKLCVGMLGDSDAAADCVQDVFCEAARDLPGLREPDKLRPWLYAMARNQALRRIRNRRREEVCDDVPDVVSAAAGPSTYVRRGELARLIAEAADGLSERDRALLLMAYSHGLDGPELSEALGITLTHANTLVYRMRETIERCLGALLVARAAHNHPSPCAALAAILAGWDGQFSILMRKRISRHIQGCMTCEQDRRRLVNPVALLGNMSGSRRPVRCAARPPGR